MKDHQANATKAVLQTGVLKSAKEVPPLSVIVRDVPEFENLAG